MAANERTLQRKRLVRDFFSLVMQGRQMEALRYFSPNCVQHNPYVHGGMKELFESMSAVQRDTKFSNSGFVIKSVLADGDMVVVHTELLANKAKPAEGGLRQAHLFRFGRGNKVVEYWDISQMVAPDMPNPAGAF